MNNKQRNLLAASGFLVVILLVAWLGMSGQYIVQESSINSCTGTTQHFKLGLYASEKANFCEAGATNTVPIKYEIKIQNPEGTFQPLASSPNGIILPCKGDSEIITTAFTPTQEAKYYILYYSNGVVNGKTVAFNSNRGIIAATCGTPVKPYTLNNGKCEPGEPDTAADCNIAIHLNPTPTFTAIPSTWYSCPSASGYCETCNGISKTVPVGQVGSLCPVATPTPTSSVATAVPTVEPTVMPTIAPTVTPTITPEVVAGFDLVSWAQKNWATLVAGIAVIVLSSVFIVGRYK